jgi:DNA polymerase V
MWNFLGWISAGFPSAAEGMEDQSLDLHSLLVRHPAATFFYRVKGDGLRDECILDQSILVVDRSVNPTPGCLVVAETDGEFIVNRFAHNVATNVCGVVVAMVTRF